MVEVVGRVVGHSELPHHSLRPDICWGGEGDDPVETDLDESEAQRLASGLGRVSLTPVLGGETPTDLDGRREMRLERRFQETGEAKEPAVGSPLERPQAESTLPEQHLDTVDERVTLSARQTRREMLHDPKVSVHPSERLPVAFGPATQNEPLGLEHGGSHEVMMRSRSRAVQPYS